MSREKSARKAFYEILVNQINVPGQTVDKIPVSDGQATTKAKLYILIEDQTAQDTSDMRNRRWNASITLSICHKQDSAYTRDIIDDIGQNIEDIITPGISSFNALPAQSGWQVTNVRLDNVDYADFQISSTESICIKFLTFNFIITKI